jgi:hypothetical protein
MDGGSVNRAITAAVSVEADIILILAESTLRVLKERSVPFIETVCLQQIYEAVVAMQLLA